MKKKKQHEYGGLMGLFINIVILYLLIFCAQDVFGDCWDNGDCSDTSILTADSFPYTITDNDRYYQISGTIECDTCLYIAADRRDIYIGGTGDDTLKYGGNGKNYSYALMGEGKITLGTITNLVVLHDVANQATDTAKYCDAIKLKYADTVRITDMYITFGGEDASAIDITAAPGQGGRHIAITNSTCSSFVHSQSTRSGYPTAAIRGCVGYAVTGSDYHFNIDTCRLLNNLHCGIHLYEAQSAYVRAEIDLCSIYVDTRNREYTSVAGGSNYEGDPFAISLWQPSYGHIKNCYIYSWPGDTQVPDSACGGNGVFLEGVHGESDNYFDVSDNVVHSRWQAGSDGDFATTNTHEKSVCLYLRWPAGNSDLENQYLNIYDNILYAYAHYDSLPRRAEAVRIHRDSGNIYTKFYNNRCFALRCDSATETTQRCHIFAIAVAQPGTTGYFTTVQYNGDYLNDVAASLVGNEIYNNYFYAHNTPIDLGSPAISEYCGNDIIFSGDTIYANYKNCNADSNTIKFDSIGNYQYHSTGNQFIDCVLLGDASESGIEWFRFSTNQDSCDGKDIQFLRIADMYVKDGSGNPINNASISMTDTYGHAHNSTTNAQGHAYDTVPYSYSWWNNSIKAGCGHTDSSYNTYQVIASKDGEADTIAAATINASWDGSDTLTLSGAGGGTGGKLMLLGFLEMDWLDYDTIPYYPYAHTVTDSGYVDYEIIASWGDITDTTVVDRWGR